MQNNDAGFYVAILRDSAKPGVKREVVKEVRTLDADEAMRVWDEAKDDDYVVTHSRIPSHGSKLLPNVHGWECEGVRFCHNGTMCNIANIMPASDSRTDSEFFFREMFIPIWKSQGRSFNRLVELVVDSIRGNSRFCFIMPDGEVKYYGDFDGDHECEFSNSSYRVYDYGCCGGSSWGRPVSGFSAGGAHAVGAGAGGFGVSQVVVRPAAVKPEPEEVFGDGERLAKLLGGSAGVAKLAMAHVVVESLTSRFMDEYEKSLLADVGNAGTLIDDFEQSICPTFPFLVNEGGSGCAASPIRTLRAWLNGAKMSPADMENFLRQYAADAEEEIFGDSYGDDGSEEAALHEEIARIAGTARLCNARFDWTATRFKKLVAAWKMSEGRRPAAKMVERTPNEVFDVLPDHPDKDAWPKLCDNLALLFKEIGKGKPAW